MVSTHSNANRPFRRPKNKMRIKRIKRRISRRMATTTSDSKSSLENKEPTDLPSVQPGRKPADLAHEPSLKKRSQSEERPSSRMQIGQRSCSLQLGSSAQVLQSPLPASLGPAIEKQPAVVNASSKRKSWFFAWPIRGLVVPHRIVNEDEGFDSFHGNNSSSSDCETERSKKRMVNEELQTAPTADCPSFPECCEKREGEICRTDVSYHVSELSGRLQEVSGNLSSLWLNLKPKCNWVFFKFLFCFRRNEPATSAETKKITVYCIKVNPSRCKASFSNSVGIRIGACYQKSE